MQTQEIGGSLRCSIQLLLRAVGFFTRLRALCPVAASPWFPVGTLSGKRTAIGTRTCCVVPWSRNERVSIGDQKILIFLIWKTSRFCPPGRKFPRFTRRPEY